MAFGRLDAAIKETKLLAPLAVQLFVDLECYRLGAVDDDQEQQLADRMIVFIPLVRRLAKLIREHDLEPPDVPVPSRVYRLLKEEAVSGFPFETLEALNVEVPTALSN